ncbi:MAG: glycoside hydrolase family 16 protein [Prolixibacteraceae bacterium]
MKRILILLFFLPLVLQACTHNKEEIQDPVVSSTLPPHIQSGYQMVWNDEFDGNTVNLAKWNFRAEGTVRNYGTVSRQTISLDGNGHVSIKVTKDSNGKYYIGELGTSGIYETTYGYFECRAMMNKQLGPHVAFWLQSNDMGKTLDPIKDGTEIDVFEYHRKTPAIVYHNLHWNGYGVNHQTTGKQVPYPTIVDGYHTFGLEWTKDIYIFYVDGVETWRSTSAVSQHAEYLILSTELTGWGGDPALGNFPDEVVFDYVRVYKPKN